MNTESGCQILAKFVQLALSFMKAIILVYACVYFNLFFCFFVFLFQSPLGHTVPSHKDLSGFKHI